MRLYWKIIKESIKILILASVISSLGGIGLESVNEKLVMLIPIIILLPALNNMTGSFGTIISSRISTLLYLGKIKERKILKSPEAAKLFFTVLVVALISSAYISLLASVIALFKGFHLTSIFVGELLLVTIAITIALVILIFFISMTAGVYIFRKDKDPDNFLIPITTAVADLGSMFLISGAIRWLF